VDHNRRLDAVNRLTRSPAVPKGIGIWLDGCTTGALTWSGPESLNLDEVESVASAGRRGGVWCWHLTDYEGAEESDFEIRRASDYLESMPRTLGGLLEWHFVDITNHRWPPVIANVNAGQKMEDPKKPLGEVVNEFCKGYFGEKLSPI